MYPYYSSPGPSVCQLQAEQAFLGAVQVLLSNFSMLSSPSSVYIPQCSASGQWRRVQCDGPPEQIFEWYERWDTRNSDGQEMTPATTLMKIMSPTEAASRNFSLFLQSLYEAGQQSIFPVLAQYPSLQDVPQLVLEGAPTQPEENILLDPYVFWQILNGQLSHYPGPYTDFSMPLAHLNLRSCWCVDEIGQELDGTRNEPGKSPTCELTHVESQFHICFEKAFWWESLCRSGSILGTVAALICPFILQSVYLYTHAAIYPLSDICPYRWSR